MTQENDSADESEDRTARAKTLVRRHFEAINERDREGIAALHADDVVVHTGGRTLRGVEAVIEDWWSQLEAIPDLEDSIELLIGEGDTVAVRYTTTGTHEGSFRGIEPTGREVEVTSMAAMRVADDEIVEVWNHPDRFGVFTQLGVIEAPTA